MKRDPSHDVIDAVDPFESGEPLDSGEVKGRPIIFVLGKHRDSISQVIPDAGQCIESSVHPTEGYLAGFGGYTFGGKFDAEGTGVFK